MAAPLLRRYLGNQISSVVQRRYFIAVKIVNNSNENNTWRHPHSEKLCQISKVGFSTEATATNEVRPGLMGINRIMLLYEDFVGLTEVKQAQDKVVNAEQKFLKIQEDRRNMQQELLAVQSEVRKISAELEKTSRTDTHYIELVKKEHEILLTEKDMTNKIKTLDKTERDYFALLSAALRESHEKERSRAEKTKYWSIIGSVIGAIIGIAGSTFNNFKRLNELRAIVTESTENTQEYKQVVENLIKNASGEKLLHEVVALPGTEENLPLIQQEVHNLINPIMMTKKILSEHTETIVTQLQEKSDALISQLKEIEKLTAINLASSNNTQVVYVGPDVQFMLQETEKNLKENNKQHIVATVLSIMLSTLLLAIVIKGN